MSEFKVGDKVVRVSYSSILLTGGKYTVDSVSGEFGEFITVEGSCALFGADNFELYVEPEQQPDSTSAIVEWLDKLVYVMTKDYTVTGIYRENETSMTIITELDDITGNQNVVEFINNRYSQLTEQANKAKREQLLKDIVSAKEAYEAKVRELELLEGK